MRCLANDKSCSQAWEILGLVKEKDTDYEHAAECYEKVRFLYPLTLTCYLVSDTPSANEYLPTQLQC
jgi:hypothetical protein